VCARRNKCENADVELEHQKKLQDNGLKGEVFPGQVPEESLKEGNIQRDQSSQPVRLSELCDTSLMAVTSNCSASCRETNVETSLDCDFHCEVDVGHTQHVRLSDPVNLPRWLHFGARDRAHLQRAFLRSIEATELVTTKPAWQESVFAKVVEFENLAVKAETERDTSHAARAGRCSTSASQSRVGECTQRFAPMCLYSTYHHTGTIYLFVSFYRHAFWSGLAKIMTYVLLAGLW
jgi:hypothetical protein